MRSIMPGRSRFRQALEMQFLWMPGRLIISLFDAGRLIADEFRDGLLMRFHISPFAFYYDIHAL